MIILKKMDEFEKLLLPIYRRQTGKTTLLKQGIDNYDKPFYLVCRTMESGKNLTSNPNAIIITHFFFKGAILDSSLPIIYDQEFLIDQFQEMKNELYDVITNVMNKVGDEKKNLKQNKS